MNGQCHMQWLSIGLGCLKQRQTVYISIHFHLPIACFSWTPGQPTCIPVATADNTIIQCNIAYA